MTGLLRPCGTLAETVRTEWDNIGRDSKDKTGQAITAERAEALKGGGPSLKSA